MPDDDTPLFARGPGTHPLGKLTDSIKTDLPEEVGEVLTRVAREQNMTRAELLREIVCWWALPDDMRKIQERRAQVAQGNGARFEPK